MRSARWRDLPSDRKPRKGANPPGRGAANRRAGDGYVQRPLAIVRTIRRGDSAIETEQATSHRDSADVHVVRLGDREFVLIGTAHISRESADLVREVIEREKPDRVCVELDERRYAALCEERSFQSLDLREVIRQRQLSTLILNLVLSAYQRQLGFKLGVMPGTELLEAARVAERLGIPVELCDRDVRVTLRRAWRAMSPWKKLSLVSVLLTSLVAGGEISEEELRNLRQQDVLSKLMEEMGAAFPALKAVLIDERDAYLAQKIRDGEGMRIVAVVGAGHVEGIRRALRDGRNADLEALERVPPSWPGWKFVAWGIPLVILGSLGIIAVRKGASVAGENLLFWVLVNGVPSALGALLAFGHPATVLAAFLAAPVTSLTPVIGAGYVTAFVQTHFKPPLVREFQEVSGDALSPRHWWRNRLLRILLVFILTTMGSVFGTWVGGAEIVSNLF